MKLKGVGFFEANIEKLLLGLMVAVAAGVVVMQFAVQPNMVRVGNQTLLPERAFDPVEQRARERDAQMSAANLDLGDKIANAREQERVLAGIEQRVMGSVSPRPEILALGRPVEIENTAGDQATDVQYAVVIPQAPTRPVVAAYAGTIDPAVVAGNEALAMLVGPTQPYDLASVTVEVMFDGTQLEERFRSSASGDLRAMPFNWWRSVEALGLQLERQELLPDGRWSNDTIIDGLPGEQSLYAMLLEDAAQGGLTREQLADDARQAYADARLFRRPMPLPTIAGQLWKPPAEALAERKATGGADQRQQAERALQQRAALLREIERDRQQLGDTGGQRDPGRDTGPRGPGGREPPPSDDRRTAPLRRMIEEKERRLAQLDQDILGLGYDPQTGEALAVTFFEDTGTDSRLLEASQVRLWAHDATAEPGKTYRYRTRLAINNPFFGREPVLVESQRALASKPVVFSEPSAWSDATVVSPKVTFFLASANDGRSGGLGPTEPTATVEVFTFYYGYYRRSTATLRPGDMLSTMADMPDGLRLPALAASPDGPDGRPGEGESRIVGTRPGETGEGQGGELVPARIRAAMDMFLVDVTVEPTTGEGLGERTSRAVAYFAPTAGTGLYRRVVGEDRQGLLYQMVSSSADEGQRQGQPRASIQVGPTPGSRERREPTETSAPTGGGKLGGGGGG